MSARETTPRLRESPWNLIRQTMGNRATRREKLRQLVGVLKVYGKNDLVEARLRRLQRLGHIGRIPTRTQRIVGAVDMMRFWIVPCAADYYARKDINFHFHTLLRFLEEPASVIDPTGFNSARDTIIGHVMQVVHANPVYDFQLLDTFEDGMEEMELQVRQVLNGTHPRTESILATVEDPDYHRRLLEHVRGYREDPSTSTLLRENVAQSPHFSRLERTFGSIHGSMQYFARLPRTPVAAALHLMLVREFPQHLAG